MNPSHRARPAHRQDPSTRRSGPRRPFQCGVPRERLARHRRGRPSTADHHSIAPAPSPRLDTPAQPQRRQPTRHRVTGVRPKSPPPDMTCRHLTCCDSLSVKQQYPPRVAALTAPVDPAVLVTLILADVLKGIARCAGWWAWSSRAPAGLVEIWEVADRVAAETTLGPRRHEFDGSPVRSIRRGLEVVPLSRNDDGPPRMRRPVGAHGEVRRGRRRPPRVQRLLNCGFLRALWKPAFLRSTWRSSRVRKPARLSGVRRFSSASQRARAMPCRTAPAWALMPPP